MSGIFDNLANPTRFRTLSAVLRPICFWSALVCFSYGLYLSLVGSPADYQQGEAVRIMCSCPFCLAGPVQLSEPWFMCVVLSGLASSSGRCGGPGNAPIGAGFTALTLLTGSLWGYPIWGTWWVWDARLTSMLVLLFFFIGYIALATGFDGPERGPDGSYSGSGWLC